MRYFLKISYKGSEYHGWQVQQNARSVQGLINETLSKILGEDISVAGSGRTDTGVHALEQYAHFDTSQLLDLQQHLYRFNALLPDDIVVHEILPVQKNAHARFDAQLRSYQYHIHQEKNAFLKGYSYYFRPELDILLMNQAATKLACGQEQDYACFNKSGGGQENTLCRIGQAHWLQKENSRLVFHISANRFLRNMVRAIVGTMLDIGSRRISLEQFDEILHSGKRSKAGRSVPAEGLYLSEVCYPQEIFTVVSSFRTT